MPTPLIIYLIVQTGLFALWAFLMFRMLWLISRRARAMNKPSDGSGAQTGNRMSAFGAFFRDRSNRRFLLTLAILSAVLMGVNIAGSYLLVPT